MKDKEIELKFIIDIKTRKKIIADLVSFAKDLGESRIVDTYYIPEFRDFEIDGVTQECIRIREDESGVTLCYKHIHRECAPVYCDEFESKVDSKEQMKKILFALGFSVQMVIDKTRASYQLGNFRLDFDNVKGLGEFMEVELISDSASVEDIYDFVSKYKLTSKDVTYDGIQTIMKRSLLNK